ncbi:MAG: DUF374 domain-containing protein [Deltaproteobacteria bacterium]|nr:DUF374 domain-containing protein [Deltaproteobacteria bacterium]
MKLRQTPLFRRWGPTLARLLVQGYLRTCPTRLTGDPVTLELMKAGRPVLFTSWHCHLLLPLTFARFYYAHRPPLVLMASPSRDGEFISDVARGLNFLVVSGSRRKGGVQALRTITQYFHNGHSGGIVADGSRGPARVVQKGVVFLAREARAPIIPLAVAARRKIVFNSWDRFELPWPLSPIVILAGAPIWVQPQERGPSLEGRRLELEARLNALYLQSQRFFTS